MNTLRRRFSTSAALCAAVLLVACGGGSSTDPEAQGGTELQATTQVVAAASTAEGSTASGTDSTTTWAYCAPENGTCSFSGTREVRYGRDNTWAKRIATGSIACNNATFGDPAFGVNKICEVAETVSTVSAPAPVTWTRCASEYDTCSFSGTREVRYGLNDQWATRTASGSIACNNATFGDPAPGVNKVCDYSSATTTTTTATTTTAPTTASWMHCADEYGTCSFSGTREVRYGLNGQWATRTASSSIACNNETFGDPAPGVNKVCEHSSTTAATTTESAPAPEPTPEPAPEPEPAPVASWTQCAVENGTCTFSGTREVRYGRDTQWAVRTATDSIACNNATFGDPAFGVNKICEYANSTSTSTSASEPASDTGGPYGQDASQYTLTFSDEFSNGFNRSVWNDTIWYEQGNPTINYTVEDGKLKIWPQRDASGNFFNRTIDTDGKYYQTYGYFEIEAKLPKGKGTWPAFWLFNHIGDRRPEIDVMEAYPGGEAPWGFTDSEGVRRPQAYAPTVWKGDVEGQLVGSRQYDTGMDLSTSFNKYAVRWEPNQQIFYFNGIEVLRLNVAMGDPKYIMLDLWFGSASGTPDHMTPQGKTNSFEVNYIRAWQFR